MYCSKCGTENDDNAFKCVNCGTVIQRPESTITSSAQQVSSHLAPAILVTIFCCLPIGIVAIIYAAQVNGKQKAGDYNGALAASKSAKTWCWVAFGLGLAIQFVVILSAIAIPQFSAYRVRSYNAAAQADLRNTATAQEAYFVDNDTYTDSIEELKGSTYGLYLSENVTIEIISAGTDHYKMVAYHEKGTQAYQLIGPGGTVEPYSQ